MQIKYLVLFGYFSHVLKIDISTNCKQRTVEPITGECMINKILHLLSMLQMFAK